MKTIISILKKNKNIILTLSLLIAIIYFNSLNNDFLSDDIPTISQNKNISKINYFWRYPYFDTNLRSFIIYLTNHFFGLRPVFFRLSNIIFHLGSSILVYLIAYKFFSKRTAIISSLIFAAHPLQTEAVTWISGGTYSNSAFFVLLSLLFYINSQKRKKFIFLSVIFFTISLLFSEKTFVLPLCLIVYEIAIGNLKKGWKKIAPFLLISIFWLVYLLGLVSPRSASLQQPQHLGTGIYNPLIQIPTAISSYLALIFWPIKLTFYHTETTMTQARFALLVAIFILFCVYCYASFKKQKSIFFWLMFFIIFLLPTLTPFKISWIIAERYVYLASLGIYIPIAVVIEKTIKKIFKKEFQTLLLVIIISILGVRTIIRNGDWKNQDSLWIATAKTSPNSAQNHNNLGDLYARKGDLARSIEEFETAIKLNPDYADAYHNLGTAYLKAGKKTEALNSYNTAVRLNNGLWQSYLNASLILIEGKKYQEAEEILKEAIGNNPHSADLYVNLYLLYKLQGKNNEATLALEKAFASDPNNQKLKLLNNPSQ